MRPAATFRCLESLPGSSSPFHSRECILLGAGRIDRRWDSDIDRSDKENLMFKYGMCIVIVTASLLTAGAKLAAAGEETKIKLADAPPAVQKTLRREAAGVTIGEIEKETEDGKTTYEVDVTIDGKPYEIQIAGDGTLIEKNLKTDDDVKIKVSDAPAAVQKTLKREASGAQIETVKREEEDNKTIYAAEVTIDGKIYEIEVAEDGTLQEKTLKEDDEVEVEFSDCPTAVQKTLKREANGAKISKVERQTAHGKPVFEIDVKIDGRNYEIIVAEDGLLLSKALDEDEENENEKKKKENEDDDD
jgi:hypothetical protein